MTAPDLKPTFYFDRYINGVKMAEDVCVERASSLSAAMVVASKIASRGPNGEAPVLVYRPTPLAEALAWVKKHGVHADDCETVTRQDEPQFSFYEMQDHLDAVSAICTCGLTAILRAIGEGRA